MASSNRILTVAFVGLLALGARGVLPAQALGEPDDGVSVGAPSAASPKAPGDGVDQAGVSGAVPAAVKAPAAAPPAEEPALEAPESEAASESPPSDAPPAETSPRSLPDKTPVPQTGEGGSAGTASTEAPQTEAAPPGDSASGAAKQGRGLKGVLNLLTGKGKSEEGADEAQRPSSDENQKRANELARLATTNIEKGRTAEAMRNINDLITLKPYEANYHFALGLCYRREGKFKEALKKYQDVLDLGGPKALVAVLRAEAYAADGKTDKVFEYLREAAVGGRNVIMDVRMLQLLSRYQNDTEFIKLALQLEKFTVARSKGFDPFTNPFPRPDAGTPGAGEGGETITALSPEDQEKMLVEARKTYERVKFYIKLEDETKAMKAYTRLRELVKQKDLLTIPKIVNDFRILVAQLEGLEIEIEGIRLKYYYSQAQAKLKQMKEFFGDGEYQNVEKLHSEVTKLTEEMRQVNQNYKPVADQILAASTRWLTRAQVRKEFQIKKPAIQGIVISDQGKMALLNDKLVKQGDAFEDFRLVKVESNRVTFRYKGEEIPLIFRRY